MTNNASTLSALYAKGQSLRREILALNGELTELSLELELAMRFAGKGWRRWLLAACRRFNLPRTPIEREIERQEKRIADLISKSLSLSELYYGNARDFDIAALLVQAAEDDGVNKGDWDEPDAMSDWLVPV